MKSIFPSRPLKFALLADAVVSGAVAALQLALTQTLAELLHLPLSLLFETGVFLVAYVALLLMQWRSRSVWSALIAIIVLGNVGWALGCLALVTTDAVAPNALGTAFVLIQAVAVLIFAAMEFKGLRESSVAQVASAHGV